MRKKKWEKDYIEFTQSCRSLPFEFGKHDCCVTACKMIDVVTGANVLETLHKQLIERVGEEAANAVKGFDTPIKALRIIKEYGDVDKIAEAVCFEHNWPEVSPPYARRADVVCIGNSGDRKALGWIDLDGVRVLSTGMIGLQYVERSKILRAWRID